MFCFCSKQKTFYAQVFNHWASVQIPWTYWVLMSLVCLQTNPNYCFLMFSCCFLENPTWFSRKPSEFGPTTHRHATSSSPSWLVGSFVWWDGWFGSSFWTWHPTYLICCIELVTSSSLHDMCSLLKSVEPAWKDGTENWAEEDLVTQVSITNGTQQRLFVSWCGHVFNEFNYW